MRIVPFLTIFFALCVTGASAAFLRLPTSEALADFFGEPSCHPELETPSRVAFLSVEAAKNVFTPQDQLDRFWVEAQKLGPRAGHVVLDKVTQVYPETGHVVKDFRNSMDQVVEQARQVRFELQTLIDERDITIEHLFERLSNEISGVYRELKSEVVDPLPEDRGERARVRAQLITRVMEKIGKAYVRAIVEVGIPRERAEDQFNRISPKVTHVLLIAGNIIDNHPMLLSSVVFATSMLLLPEIQILRPIMSMFGFGPLGPIKGSTAAWLQSRVWGGSVARGSWFAMLQKVGMTLTGSRLQRLAASVGLATGLGLVASRSCP